MDPRAAAFRQCRKRPGHWPVLLIMICLSVIRLRAWVPSTEMGVGGGNGPGNDVLPAGGARRLFATDATSPNATSADVLPVVIADGGASYIYPAMSVRAYEVAMAQGADYVLCKVYITSDAQPICRPFNDLSESTDAAQSPAPADNYTLADILKLKARQLVVVKRTLAFDNVSLIATPDDILDLLNQRASGGGNKSVGVVFELPAVSKVAGTGVTPGEVLLKMLQEDKWKALDSRLMVVSTDLPALQAFKSASATVFAFRLLLRVPRPDSAGGGQLGASPPVTPSLLGNYSAVASGILLPSSILLTQERYPILGRFVNRSRWDNSTILMARNAGLDVYVHGFIQDDWSSNGANFNGFFGDPLAFYRDLFYGPGLSSLVRGIFTEWPATAATAAACYKSPVALSQGPGLPTHRPLIMSSGGSQDLTPTQTNVSYLRAVSEGADFIDCNIQVSSDGVLFCHGDMKLLGRTNIDTITELSFTMMSHPSNGQLVSDFWSFDLTWVQIQMVRVKQQYANRDQTFHYAVPPPSLDEFFNIASNATQTVGVFIKMDDPTYLNTTVTPPINQPALLLAFLRRRGYLDEQNRHNSSVHPPLLVGSFDACGLQALYNASGGTIPLVQKFSGGGWGEPCSKIRTPDAVKPAAWWTSPEGLDFMKTYAIGINPPRALILNNVPTGGSDANARPGEADIATGFLDPTTMTTLVADAKARGLKVYPKVFMNDYTPGDSNQWAYDYQDDPSLEAQYYYDQLQVDAVETQFPATVANFFESSCRADNSGAGGFRPYTVTPGELYKEAKGPTTETAPPTESPTPTPSVSPGVSPPGRGSHLSKGAQAGIISGACALAFLAAVAGLLLYGRRWTARNSIYRKAKQLRLDTVGTNSQLKQFPYAELAAATNNFSDSNRLGKGAFGTVHKATFPDGTVVAVKSLGFSISKSKKEEVAVRQLSNELAIIGTVHNRNVVTLQGYSIDREWLLVYDFMPNGSLQDALFDPDYPLQLDWPQWFNIVVGTAKGIAYLHDGCEHKIIHRDIKPANILLDAQLNARVADFGLARNTKVEETHVTTQVMGTFGYVAPEYAASGQLTEKSDTYSFGVVLIIVITRSPLIDTKGSAHREAGTAILDWVQEKAQRGSEELMTVISDRFEGNFNQEEAERWLQVALLCVQSQPAVRPTMGDVVQMLLGNMPIPEVLITRTQIMMPSSRSTSTMGGASGVSGLSSQTNMSHTQGEDSIVDFEMSRLEGR